MIFLTTGPVLGVMQGAVAVAQIPGVTTMITVTNVITVHSSVLHLVVHLKRYPPQYHHHGLIMVLRLQ